MFQQGIKQGLIAPMISRSSSSYVNVIFRYVPKLPNHAPCFGVIGIVFCSLPTIYVREITFWLLAALGFGGSIRGYTERAITRSPRTVSYNTTSRCTNCFVQLANSVPALSSTSRAAHECTPPVCVLYTDPRAHRALSKDESALEDDDVEEDDGSVTAVLVAVTLVVAALLLLLLEVLVVAVVMLVVVVAVVAVLVVVSVDEMAICDRRHCSDCVEPLGALAMLGQLGDIEGSSLLKSSSAPSCTVSLCSGSHRAHSPSTGLKPQ
uniref:Uncharacterized protein n=1 Tax=Anopheles atroparvus TaxID=41427 RepID=A0A182J7V6_ANOAO